MLASNPQITTLAFVYNEERRLRPFLEAVRGLGPIIVIDNFSTDRTVEIAREYTSQVLQFRNAGWAEHPAVATFALSRAQTEWIYWARVDEIPPQPLIRRLKDIAATDAADVVMISRLNLLFGVPSTAWGRDYQLIFFRKSSVDMTRAGLFEHGAVQDNARMLKLPATRELSLWHFSSYDVSNYTNTNNRYSTIAASRIHDERIAAVRRTSSSREVAKRFARRLAGALRSMPYFMRLAVLPSARFLWHFVVRGGIRSGRVGLTTSYLMMMEQMLIELKVAELEKGISLDAINAKYDALKARLIAGEIPPLDVV